MAREFSCRDAGVDCDFMIRSENEDEMVDMVQQHARETHDKEMSRDDVMGAMKSA